MKRLFLLFYLGALGVLGVAGPSGAQPATPVPRGTPGDLWADRVLGQTDQAPDGSGVSLFNSAFGEVKPNQATSKSVFNVGSILVDRSGASSGQPDRLYIWDAGNSRILGFTNLNLLTPNQGVNDTEIGADIVLGQPDFSHCACNGDGNWQNYPLFTPPDATKLCGMAQNQQSTSEGGSYSNMAVDSQGNLYVPDSGNHRVLRYERGSLASGATAPPASHVWGQVGFSGMGVNEGGAPTNSSLNFGTDGINFSTVGGVAIDSQGNLWVADFGNNRVLRFPNHGGVGGVPDPAADLVLGQNNFSSGSSGTGDNQMTFPAAVRVDGAGNVFVLDNIMNPPSRILVFKPSTYLPGGVPTSGGTADFKITANFYNSYSIDLVPDSGNPALDDLWVVDRGYSQVVQFTVDCSAGNATPAKLLLQASIPAAPTNNADSTYGDGPLFYYPYPSGSPGVQKYFSNGCNGIGVASNGDVFVSFKNGLSDVWRFPHPIPGIGTLPAGQAHSADVSLFKQSQLQMINQTGPANILSGWGVAVGENMSPPQVIVADQFRLMYWDIPAGPQALDNGQAPTGYVVDPQSTPPPYLNEGPSQFGRLRVDQGTGPQHLWAVSDSPSLGRIAQVYNLPLAPFATPALQLAPLIPILGSSPVSYLDWRNGENGEGGAVGLSDIMPSWDSAVSYLWVADEGHGRVFRVRNPLSPGRVVDLILGQNDAGNQDCSNYGLLDAGQNCNQQQAPGAHTLSKPGALALDHAGNLFIADSSLETTGDARLLEYDASAIQNTGNTCLFGNSVPSGAIHVYDRGGNFGIVSSYCPPGNYPCINYPFEPAFLSDDSVMVVGTFAGSMLPPVISRPLAPTNFDPQTASPPWTTLKDYSSVVYSAVFDKENNLYTTDLDRNRVLIYFKPFMTLTPTFSPTATLTPTGTWYTPTFTPTNSLTPTFTATFTPSPAAFTPTSTPTVTPTSGCCSLAAAATAMGVVGGVALNSMGTTLYVADFGASRIDEFQIPGMAPVGAIGGFSNPYAVAFGPDGYLYVGDYSAKRVFKVDVGTGSVAANFGPVLGPVRGVAVDSAAQNYDVYVSYDAGPGQIEVFQQGVPNAAAATLNDSQLSLTPRGLLKQGNRLYVADASNNQVYELDQPVSGGYNFTTPQTVVGNGYLSQPCELAMDGSSRLYVASYTNGEIVSYRGDTSGDPTVFTYQHECATTGLYPQGVAVDGNGYVYAGANGAGGSMPYQVLQLDPCGTLTPSPLPTASPTPTPTATSTFTNTLSGTFTPTLTPTASFTATGTATFTPSWTATPTSGETPFGQPTATPTEGCLAPILYPNPVRQGVILGLHLPPCERVPGLRVKIYTLAFRKVLDKEFNQSTPGAELALDLTDDWGTPLANGLYYLVVVTPQGNRSILKLLILR